MALIRPIISPSVLASDFACLRDECADVLSSVGGACEWLHLDVMDSHFVPNLTFGPPVIQSLRKHFPAAYFDVHLMISEPNRWAEDYAKAGANMYTFHIEALDNNIEKAKELVNRIRGLGMEAGVALKPGTSVDVILPLLEKDTVSGKRAVDMVLVMTVEPGFGGQKFMKDMMEKVRRVRDMCPELNIEVDGGLAPGESIELSAEAGANVIVAGTSIFKAKDRRDVTNNLRDVVQKSIDKVAA
eukprot:Tbor_TRINITY_DN5317_c3_g3::TRINITY_DN5317_c3_g3_i1::g.4567::m.4567/K01783/rpe, RPE; ribulose-phosphate 3-epimerase